MIWCSLLLISKNGPGEALHFLNVLHPLLMEFLLLDGIDRC
jgi:DNA-directed RNA polymerase-5 subunit 1